MCLIIANSMFGEPNNLPSSEHEAEYFLRFFSAMGYITFHGSNLKAEVFCFVSLTLHCTDIRGYGIRITFCNGYIQKWK